MNGDEEDMFDALGRGGNSFSIFPWNSNMGCAACGSGRVKRRNPQVAAQQRRLEAALNRTLANYEDRDIYFLADGNDEIFSLAAAAAVIKECEELETALRLERGTYSAALWTGILDKPNIVALIEDVKGMKLKDGEIFVVTRFESKGLVLSVNIVAMPFTEAASRSSRAV